MNQMKLIVMLTLTSLYFVAELLVGFFTGSLALVSDAFHMASDSIALIIAFVAIQVASHLRSIFVNLFFISPLFSIIIRYSGAKGDKTCAIRLAGSARSSLAPL